MQRETECPECCEVLIACWERMQALETQHPAATTWEWVNHQHQLAWGPRYAHGEWFGPAANHLRARRLRAIKRLERDGLLTATREHGRVLSHVRLTPKGIEAAALAQSQSPGRPAQTETAAS